ncbi:MAG: NADH-quinone oxidoreductase subunit NuoH [Pseudomonadales bacterium]|jgi:NADH-quinone oxidoreductase subunit H|nr:NADH-quinone oxidoreductase subunit NuoH [Pseudomonadales bacterium]
MFEFSVGSVLSIVFVLGVVLVSAAMLIWVERRFLGFFSERLGPNRVGPFGVLQSIADVGKLITKEDWIPPFADKYTFVIAPIVVPVVMLLSFAVIPFAPGVGVMDLNIGLLWIFAMAGLGAYSAMLGGIASNNKFALLGGLRAAGQMISYEVFMGISILGVVMLGNSFNMRELVEAQKDGWFVLPQFVGFIVFVIAGLAETKRWPFDLAEGESEIISGFNTEYSGMKFGLFFVGEYIGMFLLAMLIPVLFFGGWLAPFGWDIGPPLVSGLLWMTIKTTFWIVFFILVRAALVRPRYDQLMNYGWLVMLPLSLLNLLITGAVVLYQGS